MDRSQIVTRLARTSGQARLVVALALTTNICGCASMLEGPEQTIRVHRSPAEDVDVLVDGRAVEMEGGIIVEARGGDDADRGCA